VNSLQTESTLPV